MLKGTLTKNIPLHHGMLVYISKMTRFGNILCLVVSERKQSSEGRKQSLVGRESNHELQLRVRIVRLVSNEFALFVLSRPRSSLPILYGSCEGTYVYVREARQRR